MAIYSIDVREKSGGLPGFLVQAFKREDGWERALTQRSCSNADEVRGAIYESATVIGRVMADQPRDETATRPVDPPKQEEREEDAAVVEAREKLESVVVAYRSLRDLVAREDNPNIRQDLRKPLAAMKIKRDEAIVRLWEAMNAE